MCSRQPAKVHIYTKNEVLLHNIIEKDFQKYLKPLNILQNCRGYPKYLIRDNFITPNGIWMKTLSFIVTSLFVVMFFFRGVIIDSKPSQVIFTRQKVKIIYLIGTQTLASPS